MQTLADGDLLLVSLSAGEEILDSLKDACAAHGVRAGFISGLGALSEVELAFFDPEKKEYLSRTFQETLETRLRFTGALTEAGQRIRRAYLNVGIRMVEHPDQHRDHGLGLYANVIQDTDYDRPRFRVGILVLQVSQER